MVDYKLIPVSKAAYRKWFRFFTSKNVWMTYRRPFQKYVRITHPDAVTDPKNDPILQHELVHYEWFKTWWGPWVIPLLAAVLPLPILLSGRWFIERPAFLADIRAGRYTITTVVNGLWTQYGYPWPKSWMTAWFQKQLIKPVK